MASAAQLADQAETELLLCNFAAAESCSRQCLALGDVGTKERALLVAIQALHETERLASARRLLHDCCGGALDTAPPHVALLWLSLSLDSQFAGEARQSIQALLDTCQPCSSGGEGAWSRRQFLALLHLYVCEVLLQELREPAEVMRWVQETRLPVTAEERQLLLEDVQEQAAAGQSLFCGGGGGGSGALGVQEAEAARVQRGSSGSEEEAGWSRLSLQPRHQQHAQPPQLSAGGAVQDSGLRSRAAGGAEIVPADEEENSSEGATKAQALAAGLEWLGSCQRQVMQTVSAVLGPLLGLPQPAPPVEQRRSGGSAATIEAAAAPALDPTATLQLLGGTVLGAVLLYSLYAERQALRRGASRARRTVVGGLGDLFSMAFALSVNPMASPAAALR